MKPQRIPIPGTPYTITFDGDICWTLLESKTVQRGKTAGTVRETPISYHGTLGQALTNCIRLLGAATPHEAIQDYIDELNASERRIQKIAENWQGRMS